MPVVVAGNPGEPPAPSILCSAQRERLVIGPGPDTGGSNQGKEGCCHVPEKSGTEAVSFAPSDLSSNENVCESPGTESIANTATQNGSFGRNDMTPPICWRLAFKIA